MPKNVKGGPFGIFEHPSCCKISKIDGENNNKISGKNEKFEQSHSAEKRASLIVSKKVERGTLLLWNGFLSHVRGFGCVEKKVLRTNGKSA